MASVRDATGLLSSDTLLLVERAAEAHPRSGEFVELVIRAALTSGLSSARVFEAEWVSGGGRSDWCVLKIDLQCRLLREGLLSARFPHAKSFMTVAARSFAAHDEVAEPGCILYEHPAGHYGGRFRPLRERTAAAFCEGSDVSLGRAVDEVADVVSHVGQQLQSGNDGRRPGAGSKQLSFYRGYWYPSAIVRVCQQRCTGSALHLELADEPVGVAIDLRGGSRALCEHIGAVVEFTADAVFLDPALVCLNVSDRAAIRIDGIDAGQLRALVEQPYGLHRRAVRVRGRVLETQEHFLGARIRALGLDPEAARWAIGAHCFDNPLRDFDMRVDGWRTRQPLPLFAFGHGDLHDGNILRSDSAIAIIDHAMAGPEQPAWADAARLIGTSWLNAIVPQLSSDEIVAVMGSLAGGTAPEGARARWAAEFLRGVIGKITEQDRELPEARRELWIDLHHFGWTACKWSGDERAQLAAFLLVAVAISQVKIADESLAVSRELAFAPVGGLRGVVEQIPERLDAGLNHARALGIDFQRSLSKIFKDRIYTFDAALERVAGPGEQLLDRLLDEALAGTWSRVDTREVQALMLPGGDGTTKGDRVLLADILYYACLNTGDLGALSVLIGMFGDEEPEVQAEAVMAVYLLRQDIALWRAVEQNPALLRRIELALHTPGVAEWALACARSNMYWMGLTPIAGLELQGLPASLQLRPFDVSKDVPAAALAKGPERTWGLLAGSVSFGAGERLALARAWPGLTEWQREQLVEILDDEATKLASVSAAGNLVARRTLTLNVFEGYLFSPERLSERALRRKQLQRGLGELVASEGQGRLLRGVEARVRADMLMAGGRTEEAQACAREGADAFAAASGMVIFGAEDWIDWGRLLGMLAKSSSDREEARALRDEACSRYEAAAGATPGAFNVLYTVGYQLGELAGSSDDLTEQRRLRVGACGKYAAAVGVKPDAHEVLFNWGWELGALAGRSEDRAEERRLRGEACEKYKAAVEVKPDKHEALNNWAWQLGALAGLCEDRADERRLREEACRKYEAAVGVKPDKHEALYGWGYQFGELARLCEDRAEKWRLREEACRKYEAAVEVKPDKHEALFNWGYELGELAGLCDDGAEERRLREEACEKYAAAVGVKPDTHEALNNWGWQLGRLAGLCEDRVGEQRLREAACGKYEAAVRVKPDKHEALYGWGFQLGALAGLCEDTAEERRLRGEACGKYEAAVGVKPDKHAALCNWGWQLGRLAGLTVDRAEERRLRGDACRKYEAAVRVKADDSENLERWGDELLRLAIWSESPSERQRYYDEMMGKFHASSKLRGTPLDQVYNYACALALLGSRCDALASLGACLQAGTVGREHARADADWAAFRQDPEWLALVEEPG